MRHPEILLSFSPTYAIALFAAHPLASFLVLGAVVLVVTGGEALYADMGHFGPRPIRVVWFALVLPALLLNYFGQGALLLAEPNAVDNPFFRLVPSLFLYPMLVVATLAAIVASQALISGAFSLTHQAVQLGYTPRVTIVHTSKQEAGQIYIPEVNKALAIGTLLLVFGFGSSTALGGAYGLAVTGTMAITTILFCVHRGRTLLVEADTGGRVPGRSFSPSTSRCSRRTCSRSGAGGWVPLVIALGVFILMTTWKRGRDAPARDTQRAFVAGLRPHREPGALEDRARARHGGVHDVGVRGHAGRAPASPQAQQGAAQPGHPAVDHREGRAGGAPLGTRRGREPDERDLSREGVLRLHAAA